MLTVVLLALLVMVLVMIASLTRIETSITGNTRKFSQARQNALLAMERAVSRLQTEAGPDERVTGTADLIAPNPHANKAKWTGIWDSGTGGLNAWLVSGNDFALGDPVAEPAVQLVGANSSDANHVWVPLEEIHGEAPDGTADVLLGRFGYWVGDEGVKARVNLVDHRTVDDPADVYLSTGADSQGGRMRHQAPQRVGTEHVEGFGAVVANDTDLEKVLDLVQMDFVNLPAASRRDHFHDVTVSSRGLQTDVTGGGLKWDLSGFLNGESSADWLLSDGGQTREIAPAISATPGAVSPTFGYLRNWWQTGVGLAGFDDVIQPRAYLAPDSSQDGIQGVHPILVRAGVRFGVHRSTPSQPEPIQYHRIRPYLVPEFALWNPFNMDLEPAKYRIRAIAKSGASVQYTVQQGAQTDVFTVPLDPPGELIFEFDAIGEAGDSDDIILRAGQSVLLSIADDLDTAPSNPGYWYPFSPGVEIPLAPRWRKSNGVYFALDDAYNYNRDDAGLDDIATALPNPADGLIEAFVLEIESGSDWIPLQTITELPAPEPVGGLGLMADGVTPFPMNDANVDGGVDDPWYRPVDPYDALAVFHGDMVAQVWNFKTADLDPSEDEPVRIFTDYNIMAPVLDGSLTSGENPLWRAMKAIEVVDTGGSNDTSDDDLVYLPVDDGDRDLALFGQSLGAEGNGENVLFEIPRAGNGPGDETAWFSLGRLAHLRMSDALYEAPYAFGSSFEPVSGAPVDYAFELNLALWDSYFLSGLPSDFTQADIDDPLYVPPFGRMRIVSRNGVLPVLEDFSDNWVTQPAAHLWTDGMFNVNSTSVQAWRAVLSSFAGVPVANRIGTAEGNADHPFARFAYPDTAGYVEGDGKSHSTAWAGYRRLTSDEIYRESGSNELGLAVEIVAELQARGAPFLSLAEFVNREPGSADAVNRAMGLLQRAIEASGINDEFDDLVPGTGGRIDGYQATNAPGYFTQADLLMALGPVLAVRSDTFLVRAYGETLNPVSGGTEGRAWCEAVVQRVPDYVDDSQDPDEAPAGDNAVYGRRFEIVGFRWLTPADI